MSIFNKKKYIIAVSGGPDSMALLHFYKNFVKAVCTVNYNKRTDSDYDVKVVQDYCKKHNLVFELHSVDKQIYENNKDNFQNLARKIRYDFFYEIAKKYNAKAILIAHHFDDFLETAYMQRQKKSKSLFYGIQKRSKWKDLEIIRPFIYIFRKNTLKRMCDEKHIPYAIDSSNESDVYDRNVVRKIIKSWDTEQVYTFKKEIEKYNKQNHSLYKQTEKDFNKFMKLNFSYDFFKTLKPENKYYLMYNFLKFNNETNKSNNKINSILDFLNSDHRNKKYRLENNNYIFIKENNIIFEQDNSIKNEQDNSVQN